MDTCKVVGTATQSMKIQQTEDILNFQQDRSLEILKDVDRINFEKSCQPFRGELIIEICELTRDLATRHTAENKPMEKHLFKTLGDWFQLIKHTKDIAKSA